VKWRTFNLLATRLFEYDLASSAVRIVGKKSMDQDGDTILYIDPKGEWLLLQLAMDLISYPGHGVGDPRNRQHWLEKLEAFFEKCNPPATVN
jgi:hypothetical protein